MQPSLTPNLGLGDEARGRTEGHGAPSCSCGGEPGSIGLGAGRRRERGERKIVIAAALQP